MVKPHNIRDYKYDNKKSLKQHHILRYLATWRDKYGLAKFVDNVLGMSGQEFLGYVGVYIKNDDTKMSANMRKCFYKVMDRHFTTTMKVLGSSEVAPYNGYTMKVLDVKHSYMLPPLIPTTLFFEAALVAEFDIILKNLNCSPKEHHVVALVCESPTHIRHYV